MEELIAQAEPSSSRSWQGPALQASHAEPHSFRNPRKSRSASPGPSRACGQPEVQPPTDSQSLSQSFHARAKSRGSRSVCPQCLGRFPHPINRCRSKELWDGSPARCHRNSNSCLINPKGSTMCFEWQRPFSCHTTHAFTLHECSGCGNADHRAQDCPKAQKP